MVRKFFINTLTAISKYAVPVRSEPGEIAFKDLIGVFGIGKLHPFTSKS
jgi:hypothetical protein